MHTCANCHSFSPTERRWEWIWTALQNDKGLYTLVSVKPQMTVRNQDVISWSSIQETSRRRTSRIGFMSQVSPDGKYIVTMLRGLKADRANSYFVVNFTDYNFLQVFYPTRGILAWYDRATGTKQPLPGADDPHYVQTNPVWSPDEKYVVFARAEARDPSAPGRKLPIVPTIPRRRRSSSTSTASRSTVAKAVRPSRLRRLQQRHEQQLSQGFAGRPLDRFCEEPQRTVDAP